MGIYDRHYVRAAPAGARGGFGGLRQAAARGWSVTTWIIIVCVAVFVIDGFMGARPVLSGHQWPIADVTVDPKQLVIVKTQPVEVIDPATNAITYALPILAFANGPHVGWAEVLLMGPIEGALYFSTARGLLRAELWRLIGFQFLHATPTHLLVNMIGLFMFGPLVEQYLGRKRYLAFYLLCGIFGALMYMTLNLAGHIAFVMHEGPVQIPGLLFSKTSTPLVGASAGIFGVLMAGAFLAPNAVVLLFFIIPMRLVTLAYGLVCVALATIILGGHNAGGEAGHLGGAIAGFYFIRHPHHLHGFFDVLGRVDPTSHHYRHGHRPRPGHGATPDRREIDRILDKISAAGLQSLSDHEKRILQEASERP